MFRWDIYIYAGDVFVHCIQVTLFNFHWSVYTYNKLKKYKNNKKGNLIRTENEI